MISFLRLENICPDAVQREQLLRKYLSMVRESGVVVVCAHTGRLDFASTEVCAHTGRLDFDLTRGEWAPRVMVFDLDATLIPCEFIDEIASRRGIAHLTRALTARAMCGEMDFKSSYLQRLELLRGTTVDEIERLIGEISLAPGAVEMLAALRDAGCRTAIITGGCERLGREIQRRLGIDALYATKLEEKNGRLTGRLAGALLDEEGKVAAFEDFCRLNGCTPAHAAAMGDGANDIKMLAAAGLAVLYTSMPGEGRTIVSLDKMWENLRVCLNFKQALSRLF